jgi:hypothetical protein
MKTIVLTGMSETDLNSQQWVWQTNGTNKKNLKQWPDEHLPMRMRSQITGRKLLPVNDQWSRKIDYEEV